MPLTVETGAGLADADSYVSREDYRAYLEKRGHPVAADDTATDAALRRATDVLDAMYADKLPGRRKNGRDQALQWPRVGAFDVSGHSIAENSVPTEVVRATCELALREERSPGSLTPDVIVGRVEKSVSVSGAVSVTYAGGADIVGDQRPVVTVVGDIMGTLVRGTRSTGSSHGFLQRA